MVHKQDTNRLLKSDLQIFSSLNKERFIAECPWGHVNPP